MSWKRLLTYITGSVDQELLLRNEYLATENRILKNQIKGRLLLSDPERISLAEIGKRLGRKALEEVAQIVQPETILRGAPAVDGAQVRWLKEPILHESWLAGQEDRRFGAPVCPRELCLGLQADCWGAEQSWTPSQPPDGGQHSQAARFTASAGKGKEDGVAGFHSFAHGSLGGG